MAAAILQRFLRKSFSPSQSPSLIRSITSLSNSLSPPNLSNTLFSLVTNADEKTDPDTKSLNPLLGFLDKEKTLTFNPPIQIFPSFPYGYFMKPVSPPGFHQWEADEALDSSTTTVWADSVKKKRKRKMNKHKYKKLRKSLRRKSRA